MKAVSQKERANLKQTCIDGATYAAVARAGNGPVPRVLCVCVRGACHCQIVGRLNHARPKVGQEQVDGALVHAPAT